jgi:glyoxylase-like metal-dependent hydrolase (beta-lactamase superfamily II)
MRFEEVTPDVLMFVGDDHESVATAFLDGGDALLVDSLGSVEDAAWMRRVLREQRNATVRVIACTHFMSDHMAGLAQFEDAKVFAHRHHRHAFLSQNRRVDAFWRDPEVVYDNMAIRWGRHELRLLHNPGKTMDHVSVDVPTADLACAGDNIVGNIVYLSRADPMQMRAAIGRLRELGRGTVIGGHMGRFPAGVLDNAMHYLDRLAQAVVAIRMHADAGGAGERIASIAIEQCLADGVEASPFEREWHRHNLEAIEVQSIFALDTALAAREARA